MSDDVVTGAVAVELVHLGSLYHDDVMDEATTRRNVDSVNAKWGNHRAILAGDFLLARASQLAASLGPEVAGLLAETIGKLCEGQIRELEDTYNVDRTVESYELSITGKTASLLATSCRVGGIVGGLPRAEIEALTEFGHSYGMAFQIVDDILDVIASDEQLGKPSGNDIVEGNYTLPVIRALDAPGGHRAASPARRPPGRRSTRAGARDRPSQSRRGRVPRRRPLVGRQGCGLAVVAPGQHRRRLAPRRRRPPHRPRL